MHWLLYIGIVLGTFIIMEGITWATHRFIMHGWLWYLHEDHHRGTTGFFEKNDAFFIIFAIQVFRQYFMERWRMFLGYRPWGSV